MVGVKRKLLKFIATFISEPTRRRRLFPTNKSSVSQLLATPSLRSTHSIRHSILAHFGKRARCGTQAAMSVEKRDYLELIRQAQLGSDPYQPPAPKPRPQPQVPPPAALGGHGGYGGAPASTLSVQNGITGYAPQQQQQQPQNPAAQGSVPDIPGVLIDRDRRDDLARHVASLCGLSHVR